MCVCVIFDVCVYICVCVCLHTCAHTFTYPHRDALLCSILDGVRASGNRDVCVKMQRTKSGMRLGPLSVPVEEEVESQYLRYMINPPPGEGMGRRGEYPCHLVRDGEEGEYPSHLVRGNTLATW